MPGDGGFGCLLWFPSFKKEKSFAKKLAKRIVK